jgi:hypothetical protein
LANRKRHWVSNPNGNPNIAQYAHLGGAPKGNSHGVTHGLTVIQKQIKRRVKRSRPYVDRRTEEGQAALRIQAGLVEDQGGIDALSTARFIAIQELTNLYYLGSKMDHQIEKYLRAHPEIKSPAALSKLFFIYRAPVTNSIAKYLELLGLDKIRPPAQSLDELFADESEGVNTNGGDHESEETKTRTEAQAEAPEETDPEKTDPAE